MNLINLLAKSVAYRLLSFITNSNNLKNKLIIENILMSLHLLQLYKRFLSISHFKILSVQYDLTSISSVVYKCQF